MHLAGAAYALVLGGALLVAGWFLGWGRSASRDASPTRTIAGRWRCSRAADLVSSPDSPASVAGFLTPLLIFLNWTPAKVAGGISALFIVVNSIAGLIGLGGKALIWQPVFLGAVVVGVAGRCSAQGVNRWRTDTFRRALASVLWIAAGKLILTGKWYAHPFLRPSQDITHCAEMNLVWWRRGR